MGRFLSPDGLIGANGDIVGYNLYAYCNNNPIIYGDSSGNFLDFLFDIASAACSLWDVITNPCDGMAWLGLAGDLFDLAVPCVSGVGETIRVVNAVDDVVDTVDTVIDVVDTVDDVVDAADALYDTSRVASNAAKVANDVGGVVDLHRPYIRKSTRKAVEAAAQKSADGFFLDANTGKIITGKYDLDILTEKSFGENERWLWKKVGRKSNLMII